MSILLIISVYILESYKFKSKSQFHQLFFIFFYLRC